MGEQYPVKVLAPAGSFESMMAGIQGGADAIYFGVDHLNMRARSAYNFRIQDMAEVKAICSEAGIDCYLTLNTIMYDHDMVLMRKIIDEAAQQKIDAVIACDPSVLEYSLSKNLPVHISTQANVSNYESVKFYSRFSDVIVLARELTLQQVRIISDSIKRDQITGPSGKEIRIEIFSHGALCMAISGKCYLSLHSYNSSANRGACKQNCRDTYKVTDQAGNAFEIDNEYIMSSKDLQTISFLDKIIKSGVSVLKIEGRGRSPEYVKETTSCYKEAVGSYFNQTYSPEKISEWMSRLEMVYNRGFWDGYYLGRKLGEWADSGGSRSSKVKTYIGKVIHFYERVKAGEFMIESDHLSLGDEILITGRKTGVLKCQVGSLRLNGTDVQTVSKGDVFSMALPEKVRPADKLYKLSDRVPLQ